MSVRTFVLAVMVMDVQPAMEQRGVYIIPNPINFMKNNNQPKQEHSENCSLFCKNRSDNALAHSCTDCKPCSEICQITPTPKEDDLEKRHYNFFVKNVECHIKDGSILTVKTIYEDFIRTELAKERERNFEEFMLLNKGAKDFVKRFGPIMKELAEE